MYLLYCISRHSVLCSYCTVHLVPALAAKEEEEVLKSFWLDSTVPGGTHRMTR